MVLERRLHQMGQVPATMLLAILRPMVQRQVQIRVATVVGLLLVGLVRLAAATVVRLLVRYLALQRHQMALLDLQQRHLQLKLPLQSPG